MAEQSTLSNGRSHLWTAVSESMDAFPTASAGLAFFSPTSTLSKPGVIGRILRHLGF